MTEFTQYSVDYGMQRAYELRARQMRAEMAARAFKALVAMVRNLAQRGGPVFDRARA